MTDQEELEILKQQKPDLVAAIRALIVEELKGFADVIRRTNIEQNRFIEKVLLPEYKK